MHGLIGMGVFFRRDLESADAHVVHVHLDGTGRGALQKQDPVIHSRVLRTTLIWICADVDLFNFALKVAFVEIICFREAAADDVSHN